MSHSMRNAVEFIGLLALVVLIRTVGFGLYQVPSGSMETTILVGERFFADKFTILFSTPKHGDIISFNDPTYQYSKNPLVNFVEEYLYGPSNWTKRIIGVPGDTIDGKIENNHPVIFRNGQKLDEPYVNKYPLIIMCDEDARKIEAQIQQQKIIMQVHGVENEVALQCYFETHCRQVSYDPSLPFDKQYFYRMTEQGALRNEQGQLILKEPGTPLEKRPNIGKCEGKNCWNGSDEFHVELGPNQYWAMGDNRLGSTDSRFWGPLEGRHIHGTIVFRIWSIDSRAWLWPLDLLAHPIDFWTRVRWARWFQRVH